MMQNGCFNFPCWARGKNKRSCVHNDGVPQEKMVSRVVTFPKSALASFPLFFAADPLVISIPQPGMLGSLTLACFAQ